MKGDAEALQRSLLKLIQELIPEASLADVEALRQQLKQKQTDEDNLTSDAANFQDAPSVALDQTVLDTTSSQQKSSLELGETLTVQDRFHALLKRRLAIEIQRNPPLFPWETEIHDYETDLGYDSVGTEVKVGVTATYIHDRLWLNQLKNLSLPVAFPDAVLTQLFQRCQELVHSSLLEGAKLVRAVEDLFPDQSQALNQIAGLVLTPAFRSSPEAIQYPAQYEKAELPQQMVLSLLAAREIIGTLTLSVSSSQPQTERQWLTELGALTLRTTYEAGPSAKLRVQTSLPCAGSLLLRGAGLQAIAQRLDPGPLSVELFDTQPQSYALEVQFADQQQAPLTFAIQIEG
jgi:hypothetical protein